MKDKKKTFLKKELWTLTVGAAFGHAGLYKESKPDDYGLNKEKLSFRSALRKYIDQNLLPLYKDGVVLDDTHLANIDALCEFSASHGHLLKKERLNFGVSQKMLNLWLKYLWCLGEIETPPPHFPVDRLIQVRMKYDPTISWTKILDHVAYMKIINHARENFAEMELDLFDRRGATTAKRSTSKTKPIKSQ